MRVLFDTTYARRAPLSGTGIYIERVCRALEAEGSIELVRTWNPRRRPPAGGGLGSLRNLGADTWWSALELPRRARRIRADVVHHPLPAYGLGSGSPQVISAMDLACERLPECFGAGFRTYAHLTHRAAARRAAAVVCISQTTARDARELWGVDPERIVVAPLGPGQAEAGAAGPAHKPAPPRHFLYVGDAEPRKNLGVLLEAYTLYRREAASPLELVLAGSARAPGARVVERPSRAELLELYAGAAALVQPSLYEGFGLTALEAMALGVPVVAAASPGLSETCGEAARLFEARSAAALARALGEIAGSEALRRDLAARGRARAAGFSWERCAQAHLAAYSLALGR